MFHDTYDATIQYRQYVVGMIELTIHFNYLKSHIELLGTLANANLFSNNITLFLVTALGFLLVKINI